MPPTSLSLRKLDRAFALAKATGDQFVAAHNRALATQCPHCSVDILPGIPCSECGHRDGPPWLLIRPDEFGYACMPINDPRAPFIFFSLRDSDR